jgi:hypothetical protein
MENIDENIPHAARMFVITILSRCFLSNLARTVVCRGAESGFRAKSTSASAAVGKRDIARSADAVRTIYLSIDRSIDLSKQHGEEKFSVCPTDLTAKRQRLDPIETKG